MGWSMSVLKNAAGALNTLGSVVGYDSLWSLNAIGGESGQRLLR